MRVLKKIGWSAATLGLALTPSGVSSETVVLKARQPARFAEPSSLRKLVIGGFGGPGGQSMSAALMQELAAPGPDGVPWFTIVSSATGAGVGILSGTVTINVSQNDSTQQRSRCVEGQGFFRCKRSVVETVSCRQQVATATVSVQVERAADRRIVYATTKPYRDTSVSCQGDPAPADISARLPAVLAGFAHAIVQDISPTEISYRVKLLENTQGLTRPGATTFKAAIKTSTRDLIASCAQWQALANGGERAAALFFANGVCAERAGDLAGAGQLFAQAAALLPGDKTVAEGTGRIRTLVAARAQAQAQAAQRAADEEAERQAVVQERDAARRNAAATERAARAAGAAARAKARQQQAAVAAARNQQRQAVASRYGASAADAILAGTVTKGMNTTQAKAAVGGPCRIEVISPGEEQWFCSGKRIVFSGGRVTFVR